MMGVTAIPLGVHIGAVFHQQTPSSEFAYQKAQARHQGPVPTLMNVGTVFRAASVRLQDARDYTPRRGIPPPR